MGMIQISGPTVFPGYLHHDGLSPFVEENGKRWYVSGDLGELDADGYLWFRGRLRALLEGRRRNDLSAGAGGALRQALPANPRRAARRRRRGRA